MKNEPKEIHYSPPMGGTAETHLAEALEAVARAQAKLEALFPIRKAAQ